MLNDASKPIFVFDDGGVLGYAFCQITEVKDNQLLEDIKTLYIDDICVDEMARGKQVGKTLYEYVRDYAQSIGCNNITLNVWEGNEPALRFYQNMGMQVQKTTMEVILNKALKLLAQRRHRHANLFAMPLGPALSAAREAGLRLRPEVGEHRRRRKERDERHGSHG